MKAFWGRVEKTDYCWIWTGSQTNNGYGSLGIQKAHRLSYELHKGEIPKGMVVKHSCDNKLCVNPDHLELGTYSENLKESYERGLRSPKKSQRDSLRLTELQIATIQNSTLPPGTLSRQFGVSSKRIRSIKEGVTLLRELDIKSIRGDSGTLKELSQKYHVSKHLMAELRRGVHNSITPATPELKEETLRLSKILIFGGKPNYSEIARRVRKTRKWVKKILQASNPRL